MSLPTRHLTKSTNTGIASSTTAAAANVARANYFIQNLGQNPLFVKEGSGASSSDFTFVLAAGSANDNGTGGSMNSSSDGCWTGIITIAGTSPRYTYTERQENV